MAVGWIGSAVTEGSDAQARGGPLAAPEAPLSLQAPLALTLLGGSASAPQHGTHSVCSSSGLGTHWSRWESSWKALLWGSSMSRP